jgi:hypothetical protein
MPSPTLSVRPILPEERARFDQTLERQHWLGGGRVSEVMRCVAEEDGEWRALVGFGSAALCVRSREELVSWSDAQRYRRLRCRLARSSGWSGTARRERPPGWSGRPT